MTGTTEAVQRQQPHPWIELRRRQGPPKVRDQHGSGFNGRLAVLITGAVGTMWCAYIFAAISLAGMPLWAPPFLVGAVQWISQNFIQLVALSVIIVGQNVQAAASDRRAEQTYMDAEAILHECLRLQDHLQQQDRVLGGLLAALGPLLQHAPADTAELESRLQQLAEDVTLRSTGNLEQ